MYVAIQVQMPARSSLTRLRPPASGRKVFAGGAFVNQVHFSSFRSIQISERFKKPRLLERVLSLIWLRLKGAQLKPLKIKLSESDKCPNDRRDTTRENKRAVYGRARRQPTAPGETSLNSWRSWKVWASHGRPLCGVTHKGRRDTL